MQPWAERGIVILLVKCPAKEHNAKSTTLARDQHILPPLTPNPESSTLPIGSLYPPQTAH